MERLPNEEQLRVIENLEDNVLLFASAGTGKTFTVANRVGKILELGKAEPKQILCITFTTKACEEMREDIGRYVGNRAKEVEIRTIHGFCFRLLREENRRRGDKYLDPTVCDELDSEALLRSLLASNLPFWQTEKEEQEGGFQEEFAIYEKKTALRDFVSAIKHVRQEQGFYSENEAEDYQKSFAYLRSASPKIYEKIMSASKKGSGQVRDYSFERLMTSFAGKLIFQYEDYLRKSNRVDYDDLILQAERYLRQEETLARWQSRYKYVIVDEMQDTSLLEYAVMRKIFHKNNVMMCGDYFQAIYEWRGSKPDYVLGEYIKEFSPKMFALSKNYRSTRILTLASFGFLRNTYPSLIGKFCPAEIVIDSQTEGEKILLMGFDNRKEEAYRIYRYLMKLDDEARAHACVMARSNYYLANLSAFFTEFNKENPEESLFFFTAEEEIQFYKKPLIKDVLAVFKLLLQRSDRVSMERITEKYVHLVGSKSLEEIRRFSDIGVSVCAFLDEGIENRLDPYHVLIESFQKGEIVVYDTETTGLDLKKDEMVQLSAVRLDKEGNVMATFDQMVLPSVPISQEAYQTHGFDEAYVRAHGGVSAKEALKRFSEFVKGATLVGHNSARFDSPLIKRQLKENGLPPLEIAGEYDTLSIAKEFHATLPDFRLATLCFKYDIVNESAHNAYADVVATGKALYRMLQEDILPTREKRREIYQKYVAKFEKIRQFFVELEKKTKNGKASEALAFVVEGMRLKNRYDKESDKRALEILTAHFREGDMQDAESFLWEYVSEAELSASRADRFFARRKAVPLLTVHQSKGCEFDVVILAGADDSNFPNMFATAERAEDEERKIFYVAISRAKKKLILTRASYHGVNVLSPSRYARFMPEEYLWKNRQWEIND